jgi:hypothetical protein
VIDEVHRWYIVGRQVVSMFNRMNNWVGYGSGICFIRIELLLVYLEDHRGRRRGNQCFRNLNL